MGYVYVLHCNDGSYYVGSTRDYHDRIVSHQAGKVKYTKSRLPVKTIFLKSFETYEEALRFEKKIKSWKKRKSIERMIKKSDNMVNRVKISMHDFIK